MNEITKQLNKNTKWTKKPIGTKITNFIFSTNGAGDYVNIACRNCGAVRSLKRLIGDSGENFIKTHRCHNG